jgi:hypothetical protein
MEMELFAGVIEINQPDVRNRCVELKKWNSGSTSSAEKKFSARER